jgi:HD-GYP domain-containing protein (c-di-GMP phosphodiesterase class II)
MTTITLSVSDLSFTKTDLVKIFRSFYRPRNSPTSSYDSLGIGFHLARELLSSMGGILNVQQDEALRITVLLPATWHSAEERVNSLHRDVDAARALAAVEIAQITAAASQNEFVPVSMVNSLGAVGSMVEKMASDASRAIFLADEALATMATERGRTAALEAGYVTFLETIVELTEFRDSHYAGHSKRVAAEALLLGRALALSESDLLNLYYAALLHDLGMIAIPETIVSKPGPLADDELSVMQEHCAIGSRSLLPSMLLVRWPGSFFTTTNGTTGPVIRWA